MNPSPNVYEEVHRAAYGFGVERLAALMGMAPGTLYNKLNQSEATAHHKLTLADYVQILKFTGDPAPHHSLSAMVGQVSHQLPDMSDQSDEALLDIVNRVHIEGGDVHRELAAALAAPVVTADLARRIEREALQWVAAILELRARVNGMVVSNGSHR